MHKLISTVPSRERAHNGLAPRGLCAGEETLLRRSLGRWDLTAIGINQVIGGAVFLVPAEIAFRLGGWSPLAVFLIGLSSMLVGLCFAEAGGRFDSTGGAYLYSRGAFGRFAGLEVAWMQWFTRVASLASVSNGIAIAISPFYPPIALGLGRALLIFGVTLSLMAVNVVGIRQSSNLVNALTIAKLAPLLGFIVIALFYIHPRYYPPLANVNSGNVAAAALLLVFTFGGFDAIGVPAGEARTPRRDVPFALIATIAIVTLILTLIETLLLLTLPGLADSTTPIADAARNFAGPVGFGIVAAGAVLSMIGNNAGQILSGSRTLFSLAETGDLPRILARVHPRFGTPVNAILATTAASLVLALSGSFVRMAAISAVARLAAYVATAAAVLVLRRRERTGQVPAAAFRIPGGPVVPVLALLGCLLVLGGATREQLSAGALALAAGAVLYAFALFGRRPSLRFFLAGCLIALPVRIPAQTPKPSDARHRARELGIVIGKYPTGQWNAITDVAGVLVGQTTIIRGSGPLHVGEGPVRTGVTAVLARRDIWSNGVFAATHTLNGDGEMTGTHWIRDLETLNYPVMLTNTGSVGGVIDAVTQYTAAKHPEHKWDFLPVVAETFDGGLNDIQGRHVHYQDVAAALDQAHDGPVEEGNVGGGTGMVCFRFKCGIGTSSRQLPASEGGYKVGVLVQANFGTRDQLTIDGVPAGRELIDVVPAASNRSPVADLATVDNSKEGSIIIVVATDAPVSSVQLERIARRSGLGLARTGSTSGNSSGDLFIAFSTANVIPLRGSEKELTIRFLTTEHVEPLFRATVEATEEAILNALTMGRTMEGANGRVAHQLPYDRLAAVMAKYGRPIVVPSR